MVEFSGGQLFGADEYSRQRSVLFAIVVATGFLAVAAGVVAITSGTTAIGAILVIVGLLVLGGAVAIATGRADDLLFEEDAATS